jgi:hypothetical protein
VPGARHPRGTRGEDGALNGAPQRVPMVVGPTVDVREVLVELVDAHAEAVELATGPASEAGWRAHCDYLGDLQRLAHQSLACIAR